MGVIAICVVSLKGEIGCVVKSSFVSYQRITALINSFSSTMEDIRISCRSSSRNALGAKRIEDCYPIAQPIPLVIGAYRLLYLLVNDMYIITVDLDKHSPFLAYDVLNKVKESIFTLLKGEVNYKALTENKIVLYYCFRRCINGMEGVSPIGKKIREIRLAVDPLYQYTNENALVDVNDVLHVGEIHADARDNTRDAWEAVLHLEGRMPNDVKKELKSSIKKSQFDSFFDTSAELPYHAIPEHAVTPISDLVIESGYDAAEVTSAFHEIEAALSQQARPAQAFQGFTASPILPASAAVCRPEDVAEERVAQATEEDNDADEEDNEEEIQVATEEIQVAVPGQTVAQPAEAIGDDEEDEGEVEELRCVQVDGLVTEMLKLEQAPERVVRKQILKGEIALKTVCPEGIPAGTTTFRMTIQNAEAFKWAPVEGVCTMTVDGGNEKTFEIHLPTENKEENVHVLTYTGPLPEGNTPVFAEALSSREDTTTSSKITATCEDCLPSIVEGLTCVLTPPLLSTDPELKRTFKFRPKGGFAKKTLKCRWTDMQMEPGQEYGFGAAVTEPVELGALPPTRDAEPCPCELKGTFNGILSGIRPSIGADKDETLNCTYVKREFLAKSTFTLVCNP